MIDDDGIAVDPEIIGIDDFPVIAGLDRIVLHHRQVEPDMILLINGLSLVNVGAAIRKEGFDLRIARLYEWTVPKERSTGLRCTGLFSPAAPFAWTGGMGPKACGPDDTK